jgi:hypothetical protein
VATLILAAGGAAVGYGVTGTMFGLQMGWLAGSVLGSLFQPTQKAQGPRLDDLKISGTEYGQPITYVQAHPRVPGQIWWSSDKREIATTTTTGGKGGGGVETTTYIYEVDVLYGLTDNIIAGVTRIWMNGKLIWTNLSTATDASIAASASTDLWTRMTVYTGATSQLPDPTYETAVGTANAVAYRNRGSIFFQGLQLGSSGQFPQLTFEVQTSANSGVMLVAVSDAGTAFKKVWTSSTGETGSWTEVTVPLNAAWTEVVWGGPAASQQFVALSLASYITMVSPDGTTWTAGSATPLDPPFGSRSWRGLIWIDELQLWAMVNGGNECYVATSTDGKTWSLMGVRADSGVDSIEARYLAYHAGTWVIFGPSGTGWRYSTNSGASWAIGTGLGPGYYGIWSDYYSKFIATLVGGTLVKSSADGSTWTTIATLGHVLGGVAEDPTTTGRIYSGSGAGYLDYSDDGGTTWTQVDYGPGTTNFVGPTWTGAFWFGYQYGGTQCFISDTLTNTDWTTGEQVQPASNFNFVASSTLTTQTPVDENLDDVVSRLCIRAGLSAAQFDVTDLANATKQVRALAITQVSTTRSVLEMLAATYFFEATVSDKIYFRLRGGASQATITYENLGASLGDSSEVEPLAFKRSNELEVPAQIALTYSNVDDDYQLDTQFSDRLLTAMESVSSIQVPIGFTAAEAKAIVDTLIMDAARSVITTNVSLLGNNCRLEPTDVITATDADGSTFRIRLTKKVDNFPVLGFEAVLDHASVLTSSGTTSTDYTGSTVVNAPADTSMVLMDSPIFRDADNNQGHYVAMRGTTPGVPWAGGGLFKSNDDIAYSQVAVVAESAILGTTTTTLGNWTGARVFDEQNSVVVDVTSAGVLTSSTRDAVLNSNAVNAMMIGSEVIQFVTATMSAAGVYTLTRLLRGSRGTEWARTGHTTGEDCVLLQTTGLRRVEMDNTELGVSRYYKGVTLGRLLSSVASAEAFTNNAVGLTPFALFDLRASRDLTTGDITFTWQRRSRLSIRAIGALGISVPLGESVESYELDLYTNSAFTTVGRTLTAASATATYTSSQQATDVRSVQDPMYVKAYQLNGTVGRGYALQAIV